MSQGGAVNPYPSKWISIGSTSILTNAAARSPSRRAGAPLTAIATSSPVIAGQRVDPAQILHHHFAGVTAHAPPGLGAERIVARAAYDHLGAGRQLTLQQ